MKTILIILLSLCISAYAGIPDKTKYDLHPPGLNKTASGQSVGPDEYQQIRNSKSEVTLVSGAYFTMGTNSGLSESALDDNCQISYGHPFAKTSYPVFSIDGNWYKADEYFSGADLLLPQKIQDTLKISAVEEDLFSFSFEIYQDSTQNEIHLLLKLRNEDQTAHTFGTGVIFDPALGKWGDGHLLWNNAFIQHDTVIQNLTGQSALTIWERAAGAKGLGVELKTGEDFNGQLIAANWIDVFDQPGPQFECSQLRDIYDLILKIHGQETDVEPGAELEFKLTLQLKEPDFTSTAFLRWDLPSTFSMENNRLFPRSFPSYLEISNSSTSGLNDVTIELDLPSAFSATYSSNPLNIPAEIPIAKRIDFNSKLVYEDMIIPIKVRLNQGGDPLDELTRLVWLPATPMSDSGLVVSSDSLSALNFPEILLRFQVKKEETDMPVINLSRENIFLYENERRIQDFSFLKDTTGGINSADIVFVLDVTGSMGGEIDEVKDNIIEFTDSLSRQGIDYRLGLVTFLDNIENIYPFTSDAQAFQNLISQQYAHGGGDGPENSLQALWEATKFDFREQTNRIAIWITDNTYHEADAVTPLTKTEVIDELLAMNILVHSIGSAVYKSGSYDPIILPTGGNYYDINGNFRDILLDISRIESSDKYLVYYNSSESGTQGNSIRLRVAYEGLGGELMLNYTPPGNVSNSDIGLKFFPNPFNPEITFLIEHQQYVKGNLSIFNILGQRVKKIPLRKGAAQKLTWNAQNESGQLVGSGYYIVQLSLVDKKGKTHRESAKILYLK